MPRRKVVRRSNNVARSRSVRDKPCVHILTLVARHSERVRLQIHVSPAQAAQLALSAIRPCLILSHCIAQRFLCACDRGSNSNNASPTPTPKTNAVVVAESESDFQQQPDDENHMRAEVRQAVSETVTAKLPAWTIKGLAIEPYQNNVFWVAADIEKGDKNVVINLVVRKFFPESGNAYWKVILENESLRQQLHNMNDADIWKN